MKLSKRLETVAELVPKGSCVLDVGCDHAFLAIVLCERGISPYAVASDIREGPLAAARSHIADAGLKDRIAAVSADGIPRDYREILLGMRTEDACGRDDLPVTLVTAGMGGMLMRQICLGHSDFPGRFRAYVASPQRDVSSFRRFLCEEGMRIDAERMVEEDGKFYPVIRAVPDGGKEIHLTEEEALYGPCLIAEGGDVFRRFLTMRRRQLEEVLSELPGTAGVRREEVEHQIDLIDHLIWK